MLVKAKWNVKDSTGWHMTGEVFQTEDDLGEAVECLEKPAGKKPEKVEAEAEKTVDAEEPKEPSTRRKRSNAK